MYTLKKVLPLLPPHCRNIAVGALVNSHLDYANALYGGLPLKDLKLLQRTQNQAVRLAAGLTWGSSVSGPRKELHWLPIQQRISFKILCLTFKAKTGLGPLYLQDRIVDYTPLRNLRSSSAHLLEIPTARLKSRGEQCFSWQGPKLWNALPERLRALPDYLTFRKSLKTFLFC